MEMDDAEYNEFMAVVKGETTTKQTNGGGTGTHSTTHTLTPPVPPLPSTTKLPPTTSNGTFRSSTVRRESSVFARRDGHLLEFDNVTLSTKANGTKKPSRVILNQLTSLFEPNSLTAVMGPSGSGKTSLLKILTGRVGKNNSSGLSLQGSVRLDGQQVDPTSLEVRKMIAYVEQDVSIPATCTPREAITFSARLRLDARITNKDIDLLVEDILENLGLTHVADTIIGGGPLMSGGLSGGEKKRVQCGVELVTRPSLVVLDEPTSGLDSYSAQALMDLLKKIADAGATVIVTIHQPPPPVVRKIDNLLLLLGGNILYDGPMGGPVEEIFESRGFPKPSDYNIADWILVSLLRGQ
jgi:ABC-type multidrug transport system ATPase subunit